MRYFIQILLALNSYTLCIAQNTFSFKGQVYHNKLGALKNVSVIIDNTYPSVTNDAGVFVVGLPNNTTHIKVALSNSDYSILYPYGGYIAIPRDLNETPQVIVGNLKENDYLNQYLSLYKLVKGKTSTPDPNVQALKIKMDSLEKLLIKFHYTESDINTAKEIQNGKDDYFPTITGDLTDYITKAIDLKTAFKYVSDYAFDNVNALQKLAEAINNYNISFQTLSRQRSNYEKRIADYWKSDSLKINFNNLTSFALDTIHVQYIYPMQQTIAMIRDYRTNRNTDLKKSIQQKISLQVQKLDVLLPKLDEDTNQIIAWLKQ